MTNKKPADGVLTIEEQVYTVWSVYAPKQSTPTKLMVMNNNTAQIHSMWDDLIEARKTALTLNKALKAQKLRDDKKALEDEQKFLDAMNYHDME